jgi:hypothetical protein
VYSIISSNYGVDDDEILNEMPKPSDVPLQDSIKRDAKTGFRQLQSEGQLE